MSNLQLEESLKKSLRASNTVNVYEEAQQANNESKLFDFVITNNSENFDETHQPIKYKKNKPSVKPEAVAKYRSKRSKLSRCYWGRKKYRDIDKEGIDVTHELNGDGKKKHDDDLEEFFKGYVSEPSNEIDKSLDRYWSSLNQKSNVNNQSLQSMLDHRRTSIRIKAVFDPSSMNDDLRLPRLVMQNRQDIYCKNDFNKFEFSPNYQRQIINEF